MKSLPLFLCGILLVCSADLFAQDTQAPRIHTRIPPVVATTTGAIDISSTDLQVPRPLRGGRPGFKNETLLRVVVPFLGMLEVEKTDHGIVIRRAKACWSTR